MRLFRKRRALIHRRGRLGEIGFEQFGPTRTGLVVAKFDATKGCKNELASVTLANGTVTFIFTSDGKALGFQGDGSGIKPASNGNARLPLSLVTTGVGNKMTGQVKVAGFCTFGNPYAGKPFAIECTAESKDSSFTGSFRSGGKLVKKDK